jgi:hypothetical protein
MHLSERPPRLAPQDRVHPTHRFVMLLAPRVLEAVQVLLQ